MLRALVMFSRARVLDLLALQCGRTVVAVAVLAGMAWCSSWPALIGLVLATMLVACWTQAAILILTITVWRGNPTDAFAALGEAAGRPAWLVLRTYCALAAGTILGSLLLVLPGVVFLARRLPLAGAAAVAEGRGGWDALRRGRTLLSGAEWPTLGAYLALASAYVVLIVGLAMTYGIALAGRMPAVAFAAMVVGGALSACINSLFAVLQGWLYLQRTGQGSAATVKPVGRRTGTLAVAAVASVVSVVVVDERLIAEAAWSPSGSMQPTLAIGDHYFVDKVAYAIRIPGVDTAVWQHRLPRRGEVVVFRSPIDADTTLAKRVVAVPGDRIEIRDKALIVNGSPVEEPYAQRGGDIMAGARDQMDARTLADGEIFVLGDNRDRSYDSRFWGAARLDDLIGRVTWVYWSRDPDTGAIRWERFGRRIDVPS